MAQSKNTRSRKPELISTMERGHQMDGDRSVLGVASALRFLRSPILCRLHKSPWDETVNRGPLSVFCVRVQKKITHARERYCSPCQWIRETPKTTQHALEVSESLECWTLQERKKKKKKKKDTEM